MLMLNLQPQIICTFKWLHQRVRVALTCVFLFSAVAARAQDVPYLMGRVNDYADILSSRTISELNSELKYFEDSTSNQVVVLTINNLGGANLEEYSVKVAETWKLGQKGKDNGVLLLVVKDDRKIRIEVGYGLEGTLTDALCSVIIQREILPKFRNGDYNSGVKAGVASILGAINGTFTAERGTANTWNSRKSSSSLVSSQSSWAYSRSLLCLPRGS